MSSNIAEQGMVSEAAVIAPLFVVNLCASTSPMALTHPSTPELKRFTFFVTRQREDGRERFRLHMGYFPTQNDAEAMLSKVRDIYPAAWAGPAPSTPAALRRTRPEGVPTPSAPPAVAAPLAVAAPPAVAAPLAVTAPPAAAAPLAVTAPPAAPTAMVTPAPAVVPAAPATPASAAMPTLDAMSNVRDVLARLSDATPVSTPRLPVANAPAPRAANSPPPAAAKAPAAAVKAPAPAKSLTAVQTLDVLEFSMAPASAPRKPDGRFRPFGAETDDGQVRVVTPEDTQTLTDIRLDAQTNAPPCFAVQLVWSVTPIDITKQAHLAIFDAYTLYSVEGNRQGRRWYGLRLGFFSDPNSATQVAYYVRSDYPKVAVVPVATRERERANGGNASAGKARLGEQAAPLKPETQTAIEKQGLDGFELLQDDRPVQPKLDVGDPPPSAARTTARAAIAAAMARTDPLKPAAKPGAPAKAAGKRVASRSSSGGFKKSYAPGAPTPLESTLEILGASTLTLDESRENINDSAIRAPATKKSDSATGRFARLLGRLGGG